MAAQSSKEIVRKTITFSSPDRLAYDLPPDFGSDFEYCPMSPLPEDKPENGTDEWGVEWKNIGTSSFGQPQNIALNNWADLDKIDIPDIESEDRWQDLEGIRRRFPDKFLVGYGMCIYDRAHYLRGLENLWTDIYLNTHELERLLDILVELNLRAIKMYSRLQYDGYYFWDDWGLQDRLMISPEAWRKIWKPRYRTIFEAAHKADMYTFLHSCGYIVDILDDLIEAGLDVIQMDQQENMGLNLLAERFAGTVTFFSPVDIQTVMSNGSEKEIRQYCYKMVENLGTKNGGFIAKYYIDSKAAGHSPKSLNAMCQEFLKIANCPSS